MNERATKNDGDLSVHVEEELEGVRERKWKGAAGGEGWWVIFWGGKLLVFVKVKGYIYI